MNGHAEDKNGAPIESNSDAEQPKNGVNGVKKGPVELYLNRISPPCKTVWLYMLQHDIPHVLIDVHFSKGANNLPEVFRSQPHQEVPILVDGDLTIFECPVIIRYLATKYTDFAGFGLNYQQQLTNEAIVCWANNELHRSVGYSHIYPQFLEHYSLTPEDANEHLIENGLRQLTKHLEHIEKRYLSKNKYLTGARITVADTAVANVLVLMDWTGFKFKMWPKVDKWLNTVRQSYFWDNVHSSHNDFVRELQRSSVLLD
nr:glutathione S-transferase [Tegillarca granosa]